MRGGDAASLETSRLAGRCHGRSRLAGASAALAAASAPGGGVRDAAGVIIRHAAGVLIRHAAGVIIRHAAGVLIRHAWPA